MSIVSESLGKLYVQNSEKLKPALSQNLSSSDVAAKVTAMKSIKYSAYKSNDVKAYQSFMPNLISAIEE